MILTLFKVVLLMVQTAAILTPIIRYAIRYAAKVYAVRKICKHPELSDSKVESLTKMFCGKKQ